MRTSNLILLSGGLDSVVLAHDTVRAYGREHVRAIHFKLSPELGERGLRSALATADRLGIGLDVVELTSLVGALTSHGEEMQNPEFPNEWDTKNETQPGTPTVMPAVVAAAMFYCQMLGIPNLTLGLIANQAAGNPRLGPSVEGLSELVARMNPRGISQVGIRMPYIGMDKSQVIARGATLGVRLAETWSCLDPTARVHCGTCAQCVERRNSFKVANVPDDTAYSS